MADSKLVDLTADTSPTSDDLIYTVNSPGGTPADRKVTLANLASALAGMAGMTGAFVAKDGLSTLSSRTDAPASPVEGDLWYDADDVVPPVDSADVVVDNSAFTVITGTDVQTVLDSVDDELAGISGGVGSSVVVVKTADETVTSSTTLQDDNHLSFSIAANETWVVEGALCLTSAGTAGDFKAGWTVPAACTGKWLLTGFEVGIGASSSTEGLGRFQSHSIANTLQCGVPASANANSGCTVWACFINGANAGTVHFQWAQATSDGSGTTVQSASFLKATRAA